MEEKNTKQNFETMPVATICNGTVIDHIPSSKLFKVASLLHLETAAQPITIGNNFPSKLLGRKGIIKISDQFVSDDILNRIALIAPNVHLNIIRNYQVVEKKCVQLPEEIIGIVRCPNPKCITNHEPMATRFRSNSNQEETTIACSYCGRKIKSEQIELL
ncbi:aspartate carbamoyltransferase regulatory subunit [Porphyromonas circumdentaria]|uniref:Aspartate carbamoyltransferase regulatory chain n=1 Tax=Porphyromonas circumdentaria TaxID=29524 RepID=A0A1T4M612_9PORP|nr:aspartate carbamoyltransferase regulatory subunit [Porphyromonas circumdentaria]MBB6275563.1 aspartate carbamoyltransferase regulatory subunit [Porphyromonas circumdentaria]MDO4722141.1 aspartate carbamoyltransferase regulatory subunit [Porphyromonas circumdentaria]SJZ62218.1 aspartate carbamoyltransferase regulatory subunit [Porphyromonas circumdentaria]